MQDSPLRRPIHPRPSLVPERIKRWHLDDLRFQSAVPRGQSRVAFHFIVSVGSRFPRSTWREVSLSSPTFVYHQYLLAPHPHTHTPLLYYGVNHHRGQGQWMIVTIWYTTLRAAVGQPPHPLSQRKGGATVGSQDPRCRESEIRSKTLKDTLPFPRVNMNVSTYPISLESFTQCLLLVTHLRYIPIFPPLLRYIYLYTNYGCDIRDASCKFR